MSSAINDCSGQALESKTPKKCDLQVSELTSSTETGSFSEEERGWLGDIGADFRTLAISLKDTAGGVVDFVQRSAVSVANEIAQLELDVGDGGSIDGEPLPLPWEIKKGGSDEYVENLELQEMIFALSTEESTFFTPFSSQESSNTMESSSGLTPPFALDEHRIQLIRHLLELDDGLAATHARLSGRSDVRETMFWRNYFHHCEETRQEYLRDIETNLDSSRLSPNSLVPATSSQCESDDDSSFLIVGKPFLPSAPTSLDSTGFRSVDGVFVVEPSASLGIPKVVGELENSK